MSENDTQKPVAPYLAVGLSTVVHGVGERKHIRRNLAVIEDGIHAAMSVIGINMPVRLIALAAGALTGFTDEAFDIPHVTAARDLFIDVPGEETEVLAALARHYDVYLVVQCKARWPEVMPNRYFNTLFVISPQGEVVHKAAKNHLWCRERSCTPHDVYDRWVELFGDGIEAFYPVLRTGDTNLAASVDYQFANGTANNQLDFRGTNGTVSDDTFARIMAQLPADQTPHVYFITVKAPRETSSISTCVAKTYLRIASGNESRRSGSKCTRSSSSVARISMYPTIRPWTVSIAASRASPVREVVRMTGRSPIRPASRAMAASARPLSPIRQEKTRFKPAAPGLGVSGTRP